MYIKFSVYMRHIIIRDDGEAVCAVLSVRSICGESASAGLSGSTKQFRLTGSMADLSSSLAR